MNKSTATKTLAPLLKAFHSYGLIIAVFLCVTTVIDVIKTCPMLHIFVVFLRSQYDQTLHGDIKQNINDKNFRHAYNLNYSAGCV